MPWLLELWHTRHRVGIAGPCEHGGVTVWGDMVAVAAQGLGRGTPAVARSCCLVPALSQVQDSAAQPKSTSSCAYHPRVLVRSWDGLTRGLMPREQETGLSWESWENEIKVLINAPWQVEHSHKWEDSLCMSYSLYSNETTDNPVEIFQKNNLAMPI